MTYFVSDIHGEYDLFIKLLEKIKFSENDEMYILGDIIDKGKYSVKLIKYIMQKPNIHCIIGNHEHSFLYEYYSLMENSPGDFSRVLRTLQKRFMDEDESLTFDMIDWLECLPYYAEGEDFIAVHAGIPEGEDGALVSPADTTPEFLIYDRKFKEPTYAPKCDKCFIFGHTPTVYVCCEPKVLAYKRKGRVGDKIKDFSKIHIDTDTWSSKVLGCLCKEKLTVTYVKG